MRFAATAAESDGAKHKKEQVPFFEVKFIDVEEMNSQQSEVRREKPRKK